MTFKSLSLSYILTTNLIIVIIMATVNGCIGAFGWPYVINSWLLYCGKTAVVTNLTGFIIGLPFGFISIPLSVITYIIMLFL